MIVLHLDSEKTWRGGEQQVSYLIEELKNFGVSSIVGAHPESKLYQYAIENNIEVIKIPYGGLQLNAAKVVANYCKDKKVDFIHMHSAKAHTVGVYSTWFGHNSDLILSKRTDFAVRNNFMSLYKYNHPKIKKILCVSNKIKEILDRSLKDNSISMTVYSGINPERFNVKNIEGYLKNKFNLSHDSIIIGNTSAISDHKDYFTFLNVAKNISSKDKRFKFFIIGSGPLEQQVKDEVKKLHLDNCVYFTGFINNITEVLRNLDIFLMTSKEEGLGTSLLDAMICKVPIVATAAGGIPEIVKHENTGLLSQVGDAEHLANNLLRMYNEKELQTQCVENAYKMVKDNFSKKMTAKKTFEVYEQCLQGQ